jgi:uncharacterized lipoprotein YmbA
MTKPRIFIAHALALLAGLMTGCSTPPPPTLLSLPLPESSAKAPATTLVALPPAPGASTPATSPKTLTVRRVGIPEYLQTDAVRYRQADSTLVEWPGVAWAERLEVGMTSQLTVRLRQALPDWTVCDAHCPTGAKSMVLIADITPLDYLRPKGTLRADVHWRVMTGEALNTPLRSGGAASTLNVAPDSPVGQAAALSDLLDAMARDIAQSLR